MERKWYPDVWIGLNDLKNKGVYEWSDGSSVSWTNWYVGQPDERRTDKSCVYMSLSRGKRGWMYWRDQNCTNKYAFVCKYNVGKLRWRNRYIECVFYQVLPRQIFCFDISMFYYFLRFPLYR